MAGSWINDKQRVIGVKLIDDRGRRGEEGQQRREGGGGTSAGEGKGSSTEQGESLGVGRQWMSGEDGESSGESAIYAGSATGIRAADTVRVGVEGREGCVVESE